MSRCFTTIVAIAVIAAFAVTTVVAEDAQEGWAKSVSLGAVLTDGNSETLLVKAGFLAENGDEVNPVRFGVEGTYGENTTEDDAGEDETETTAQNVKGFANYKRVMDSGAYGYFDGVVLHDDLADVDYRITAGPGVGFFVYEDDAAKCGVEIGASIVSEDVGELGSGEYWALRFAERYDRQLSETAKIWQSIEYLPAADDFDDYLLNGEIGIDAALSENVSLRAVLSDQYDATPAPGKDNNDLTLSTGINIRL